MISLDISQCFVEMFDFFESIKILDATRFVPFDVLLV